MKHLAQAEASVKVNATRKTTGKKFSHTDMKTEGAIRTTVIVHRQARVEQREMMNPKGTLGIAMDRDWNPIVQIS